MILRTTMALLLLLAAPLGAEVVRIEVKSRADILDGKSFGTAGPYEKMSGTIYFAVDPRNPADAIITDLDQAPKNAAGKVEFSSDFYLIKPKDPTRGNGTVLYEVSNRGGKGMVSFFNRASGGTDPQTPAQFGDGFLLEQGFTLLWVGWQFDPPLRDGLVRVHAPIARDADGRAIQGLVRSDFVPVKPMTQASLADRDHVAYAVSSPNDPANVLTVRDSVEGARRTIPRDQWQFTEDGKSIRMAAGFEPRKIYEVVYRSQDPPVVGVGPAAIRDTISRLKYGSTGEVGLASGAIKRAIAFGISQSGRFLRTYLYYGFNEDESRRKVFDGVMAHVAGGGRGSFNHRFAQPSRDGHPYLNFFYPTDIFPFSDVAQRDPQTGTTDGLLTHSPKPQFQPRVFYTNTSYEYWGRAASLVHTTIDGREDVKLPATTRVYHLTAGQHGVAGFPPSRTIGQQPNNPLDYRWVMRRLLVSMNRWITDGTEPPASAYPRVDQGTLVTPDKLKFPAIPNVAVPKTPHKAYRADYGPDFIGKGIVTQEPPKLGSAFPILVPQVDADGNEVAGIRVPELAVPLATFTGWNLFNDQSGPAGVLSSMQGSFIPLPRTREERERLGDPRRSIAEHYDSRDRYLALVSQAANELVVKGHLLKEDLPRLLEEAGKRWDYVTSRPATEQPPALDAVLNALTMRNIGPFRSGSWATSIAVPETPRRDHLYTVWVGMRSGGAWKTTNGGVTWDPVFDSAGVAAIGDIAIAPSDPRTVWVGTGDQANARSSYSGRGIFKTTDEGKTWQSMGLPDSHHIARIVIDPKDPNAVFVAVMGHLFSRNQERGVFRTLDGGRTWKKVLYVDDQTGAIDLVMSRQTPRVLYAAMYDKQRLPWRLIESGPGSGIYKTVDGGDTWQKLSGGLPSGQIGRIGLDLVQTNPSIVYALIENQNQPAPRETSEGRGPSTGSGQAGGRGATAQAGGRGATAQGSRGGSQPIVGNELYRSDDGGTTWRLTSPTNVAGGKAPYSFNQLRVDPSNDQRVIVTSDRMTVTEDGGKTWDDTKIWPNGFFRRSFGDFRTMWFDPDDPQRILLGSDGGLQISFDGGHTSDYFPNIRAGEAYAIGVDMDDPYHVYAGFQDHDSWKGPVNGRWGVITLEDWVTVGPGDGMYNVIDPTDSRWVYNTREMNQMGRMDQRTGVRADIRPPQPPGMDRLRYNWIAPIAMSPHDPKTIYAGAQVLFRSRDRGDQWDVISPDLTTRDESKIGYTTTPFCTISSIAESPLTAGVIWVGTDDGKVQLTRDDGKTWTDLTPALIAVGANGERWVSRVFASPHDAATAFVAKNGFRNDDFTPYLYKTTDFGRTWSAVAGNLPAAPINVVVQDRKNPHLLIAGNDIGVFVSIDDGRQWARLKGNLPTVAVHDLLVHPREQDLALATYGRAVWVGDISPLQELTPDVLEKSVHLFDIEPRTRYGFGAQGMNYQLYGNKYIQVPNEPDAIVVNYYVKNAESARARVTIVDAGGGVKRQLEGPAQAGLNRVVVPLGGGGGRGGGGTTGPAIFAPGTYQVTLEVAGQTLTKPAVVRERIRSTGGTP